MSKSKSRDTALNFARLIVADFESDEIPEYIGGERTMTNFETALGILSQQLPTSRQALAFRDWLQAHDLLEMGAVGIKPDARPDFDAIRQLFSETTFHALEGCYHWNTNLLDYFRRRAGNIRWLESLAE